MIGRMCREGQTAQCVYAVIIADRKFRGDQAAFDIKDERAKEDGEMTRLFHREDFPVFEKINLYQRSSSKSVRIIWPMSIRLWRNINSGRNNCKKSNKVVFLAPKKTL